MGIISGVSWAQASWSSWYGCTKVSEGCRFCYAERDMKRYGKDPNIVVRSSDATFLAPHKWHNKRVFVCPWSDFFIEEADAWREDAWKVMRGTNSNTYMLLTKRPERILQCLPWVDWKDRWPNVWIGVSVENQKQADIRIPLLAEVPAQVRFLSIEPMLEILDISPHLDYAYPKGECRNECLAERTGFVQTDRIGGMENRQSREDMELLWKKDGTSITRRLSSSKENDKRNQAVRHGTQIGLPVLYREYPARDDHQPQKWDQIRQQARELGNNDLLREYSPFHKDTQEKSEAFRSMGGKESNGEVNQFSSRGNSGDICKGRGNSREIGETVRGSLSNNIENSTWGTPQETIGENCKLCSKEKAQQYNAERKGPISLCIVGGESGMGCRPFDIEWARHLLKQTRLYEVSFFMKQLGGYPNKKDKMSDFPEDLRVRELPLGQL